MESNGPEAAYQVARQTLAKHAAGTHVLSADALRYQTEILLICERYFAQVGWPAPLPEDAE